jgi:hypothetical protein
MEDKTERLIAHLAMIQAIIARLATNSFALKTLSVTLCAGVVALLAAIQKPSLFYIVAALLPIIVFWLMDAKLLQLERLYRRLYDDVRSGGDLEPFDMRVDRYRTAVQPVIRIAVSWSVSAIYPTLLVLLAIVALGITRSSGS